MTASVISDYTLLIPLSWLLGIHAGLGLPGLYLAWTAFAVLYSLLLVPHYRRRFARSGPRPRPAARADAEGSARPALGGPPAR